MTTVVASRLSELENTIERGLATFVEVGQALLEIRESRLYSDSHETFEDYCRGRWGMSRDYAYKQIAASEVCRQLSTPPANEAQARELVPLLDKPDELVEAWTTAQEKGSANGGLTAEVIRSVVRPSVHFSSESDEWETPQDLFDQLDAEFGFDLDVCTLESSAKCERYFTPEDDGLAQEWVGTCWMNPPYGDVIRNWVRKARESAQAGATVVCLVPARVDTAWWRNAFTEDGRAAGDIRFLVGRLKFGGSQNSAPFPSAVVALGPEVDVGVRWWDRGV